MSNFILKINEILSNNEPVVLATIVSSQGATPRSTGAQMIVLMDGTAIDTIGGGLVEQKVIKKALKVFSSKQSTLAYYNLTGKDAASMDMICGGRLSVSIAFIDSTDENKLLFQKAVQLLNEETEFLLVTGYTNGGGSRALALERALLTADGIVAGHLAMEDALKGYLEKITPKTPMTVSFNDHHYFIEPFGTKETVYIFGGGHVSEQIAKLTDLIEMHTVVLDDREEYANKRRFQTADVVVLDNFETAFDQLDIHNNSYIIIVTRGHIHDRTVLRQALKTTPKYIGMIGSRKKRDAIYESLIMEGIDPEDLKQVHSPIGLDINSETPQEIAVSIIAELIAVRRG